MPINTIDSKVKCDGESSLAEQLTWELLDNRISESGKRQLEQLLATDEECRRCYVACVDLHQMLSEYFQQTGARKEQPTPEKHPIGATLDGLMRDLMGSQPGSLLEQ